MLMNPLATYRPSRNLPALLAVAVLALSHPALAADEADAPKGAAVTVLTAAKSCFADVVEGSGIVLARDETAVRPQRQGLQGAGILNQAGGTLTAGPPLGPR